MKQFKLISFFLFLLGFSLSAETISSINDKGETALKTPENLTTWIFEEGTFVPMAKLQDGKSYSIITDHLGTPTEAYDEEGKKVWSRQLNIYGETRKETGFENFIPFLYQGQYLDEETELVYNRFRYYDSSAGIYISQDPAGLYAGVNFYQYVKDVNNDVDVLGLMPLSNPVNQGHHMVPHSAATDLGVAPFNSQTGVPSMYFDDAGFSTQHSAMHGYNGIGTDTKPLVKSSQITAAGMSNDDWLKSLDAHYNNPALANVTGDLHLINADGTKGKLLKANATAAEAWEATKKWAKAQGFAMPC